MQMGRKRWKRGKGRWRKVKGEKEERETQASTLGRKPGDAN